MHYLREIFSPSHPVGRSRLAALDARLKTLTALAMVLAIVLSTRFTLALAGFALCLAVAVVARVPLRLMLRRLLGPLGFAVVICLLRAFLIPGEPWLSLHLGPWHFSASRSGTISGALLGSRVLAAAGIVILLGALTPVHRIFAVLRWAGIPRTWTSIAILMYRHIFSLFEQAGNVLAAHKMRLGYDGLRRSLSSMGCLAGIVTLRSLDQAQQTHEAMLARGYQGVLPVGPLPALRRGQIAALCGVLIGIAAALAATERWLP